MRKLIVIRGNSSSGKTTVALELQKMLGRNTMLISQDVVRRDILYVKDGENTLALPLLKELLLYGYAHSEIVILEGILRSDWYKPLFELAVQLFQTNIYAYYFDLTFEETLKRHQTSPKCTKFGEKEMRKWWCEKDYVSILKETTITFEKDVKSIVNEIYYNVLNH